MAEPSSLIEEQRDGVLWLTLNRPDARNAIDFDLRERLRRAFVETAADQRVRVVVLRGDERAFCAGGDITQMNVSAEVSAGKLAKAAETVEAIAALPKPVVAAVRGHAAGAGFSLALACDIVVADPTAQFRAAFIGRGLAPDMGGTFWLARQVGLHRAKEIFLTGRVVDAEEAYRLGIVTRLYARDDFDEGLGVLVRQLAERHTPALGATKVLLNTSFERTVAEQLVAEGVEQVDLAVAAVARSAAVTDARGARSGT